MRRLARARPGGRRTPRATPGSARRRRCRGRPRRGSRRRGAGRAPPQDPAPVPRRVLVEDGAVGRVEHVHERAAVAARTLAARREVRRARPGRAIAKCAPSSPKRASRSWWVSAEVAEADLVGLVHPRVRPHAGVLRRVDGRVTSSESRTRSPPATGMSWLIGTPCGLHDPDRLVRADDRRAGVARDPLRAPEVVEVRMADDDPVGAVDVVGGQAGARRVRDPVDVGVEEHDELADGQPERRAAVPVERRHTHLASAIVGFLLQSSRKPTTAGGEA